MDADSPLVWVAVAAIVFAATFLLTGSVAQGLVAGAMLTAMAFTFRRMSRM